MDKVTIETRYYSDGLVRDFMGGELIRETHYHDHCPLVVINDIQYLHAAIRKVFHVDILLAPRTDHPAATRTNQLSRLISVHKRKGTEDQNG